LKLIVKEDHRSPVVVSQVWYKVGSAQEPAGITGISHALEHMMFKGTKKYPNGEFSKIISAIGGRENASTSSDYTNYYQQLSADRLETSFKLESDRMRNLILEDGEFKKEIQVVMEERRMRTDDNPKRVTYEQFMGTFAGSPYQHPVIGWMTDLKNMHTKDLKEWYQRWYAPNNATLVVVGDVNPKEVLALAKKYYEPLEPSHIPEIKLRKAAPLHGEKNISVKAPAQLPWLIIGYTAPTLKTAKDKSEPYALEVLSAVLSGGESARLEKELIRQQQIATDASAGYDLYSRYDDVFILEGTPAKNVKVKQLKDAFLNQIKRLQVEDISEAELNRIKNQVVAGKIYAKDSMFYQAREIGVLETVGLSWKDGEEYVKRIQAVTPEQVKAVAKKYLDQSKLTVAVLDPQPLSNKK